MLAFFFPLLPFPPYTPFETIKTYFQKCRTTLTSGHGYAENYSSRPPEGAWGTGFQPLLLAQQSHEPLQIACWYENKLEQCLRRLHHSAPQHTLDVNICKQVLLHPNASQP